VRYLEQRRVVFANLDVAQLSIDRCELAISDYELADAPHRDSLSAEPQRADCAAFWRILVHREFRC
jgi:hypothetical protein